MDLTRYYTSFSMIQNIALWAGVIGSIQSVIWIVLTIFSILSYFCIFGIDSYVSYGSITQFVFFELYFRGDCKPNEYAYVNYEILKSVPTVFNSAQILIWACVYLGISLAWLASSIALVTHVRKDNVNFTIGVLSTWASITLIICCMDFSLGVIFGIDFSRFQWQAYNYNAAIYQGGVQAEAVQLVSAQIASIIMMLVSLKGFTLWIINFGLLIFISMAAFSVQNTVNDYINHTFNNSTSTVLSSRTPINAFETKSPTVFDNPTFITDQRSSPIELNEEPINRAARIATDKNLQERRFRNIESFQQYPPPRQQQQQSPQHNSSNEPSFPAPDYTPPMTRANQNGQVRNTRYQ